MNEAVTFGKNDTSKLNIIKKTQGLAVEETKGTVAKKKFKKKQPNPLSCKKKKKKQTSSTGDKAKTSEGVRDKTIEKTKRKRLLIPKHVKELLKDNKI